MNTQNDVDFECAFVFLHNFRLQCAKWNIILNCCLLQYILCPVSLDLRFRVYCFEFVSRDGALVRSPLREESSASMWNRCQANLTAKPAGYRSSLSADKWSEASSRLIGSSPQWADVSGIIYTFSGCLMRAMAYQLTADLTSTCPIIRPI